VPEPNGLQRAVAWYSDDGGYTYHSRWLFGRGTSRQAPLPTEGVEATQMAVFVQADYGNGLVLSSAPHFGSEFCLRVRPHPLSPEAPHRIVTADVPYSSTVDELAPLRATVCYDEYAHHLPVAVLLGDGFPGSREGLQAVARRLAEQDVYAIMPSMRGRDGLGGAADAGGRELHDVVDCVREIIGTDPLMHASGSQVSLIGYGIGGLQALLCAARFPDTFASVHALAPPGDWAQVFAGLSGAEAMRLRLAIGGTPTGAAPRYEIRSAVTVAPNLSRTDAFLYQDAPARDRKSGLGRQLKKAGGDRLVTETVTADLAGAPAIEPDSAGAQEALERLLPDLRRGTWYNERLPQSGELVVPGFLETGPFSVWLNDGRNAVATLRYRLTEERRAFEIQLVSGPTRPSTVQITVPSLLGEKWEATGTGAGVQVQWRGREMVLACRLGVGAKARAEFSRVFVT
jgi:pimeloyl-ACP methyl ester carboxylesterase